MTAAAKQPACCLGLHVAGILRHTCQDRFWQQVAPAEPRTLRSVK